MFLCKPAFYIRTGIHPWSCMSLKVDMITYALLGVLCGGVVLLGGILCSGVFGGVLQWGVTSEEMVETHLIKLS